MSVFFYYFRVFFQGKFWIFLHNRVATLVRQLLNWQWQPQYSSRLRSRTENNCWFMLCLHL